MWVKNHWKFCTTKLINYLLVFSIEKLWRHRPIDTGKLLLVKESSYLTWTLRINIFKLFKIEAINVSAKFSGDSPVTDIHAWIIVTSILILQQTKRQMVFVYSFVSPKGPTTLMRTSTSERVNSCTSHKCNLLSIGYSYYRLL